MKYIPRPYQEEAIEAALNHFENGKGNGIIVAPTGSGKAIISAGIANRTKGPVLICQPSLEILAQNYEKLVSFGHHPGVFSASAGRKDVKHITLATIGSIVNQMHLFVGFDKIIIDECHLADNALDKSKDSTMFSRFLAEMNHPRLVGLTATPWKLRSNMAGSQNKFITRLQKGLWDEVIHLTQIGDLLEQGYIAKAEYFRSKGIDPSTLKINSSGSDYTDASVRAAIADCELETKVINMCQRLVKHGRKSILVFVPFVENARKVAQFYPDAEMVSGETPKKERSSIITRFRSGRTKIVVNVGVMCLDDKTEILTEQGWTGIDDMSHSHNVACWSLDGSITFAPPKFIVRRQRKEGERMVVSKGNAIDFRVTEDHRMVRSIGRDRRWGEQLARDVVNKAFDFPSSGHADPLDISPDHFQSDDNTRRLRINATAYNYRNSGATVEDARLQATEMVDRRLAMRHASPADVSLDECRFIGFWLADGTLSRGRCSITQSMRYGNIVDWFDQVLKRAGIHYTKHSYAAVGNMKESVIRWNFSSGMGGKGQHVTGGYYRLKPYMDKLGSKLFWGLNEAQFGALLEGFWYGDGYHGTTDYEESTSRWCVAGTQKMLYDLLQCVGACRGYRMTLRPVKNRNPKHSPQWKLRWQKRTRTSIGWARPQFEEGWKEERVWCVTSETSFIITRRNGIVTITGNTTGFDYPELDTVILARPTKSLSLYYQMVGRVLRPHPGKTSAYVVDLVEVTKNFGPVSDFKITKDYKGRWVVKSGDRQLTNTYISEPKVDYSSAGPRPW